MYDVTMQEAGDVADRARVIRALTLPEALVTRIKNVLLGERDISRVGRKKAIQDAMDERLESDLMSRIADRRDIINQGNSTDPTQLEKEVHVLKDMLRDVRSAIQSRASRLDYERDRFQRLQDQVLAELALAFLDAGLLQEDGLMDSPITERHVEQEIERYSHWRYAHCGWAWARYVPGNSNPGRQYVDSERRAGNEIDDALSEAHWHYELKLEQARWDFDNRVATRDRELRQMLQNAAGDGQGVSEAVQEDFDRRWLVKVGEMSKALTKAEESYRRARMELIAARTPMAGSDVDSFLAKEDAGPFAFDERSDQCLVTPAHRAQIESWLQTVPAETQEEEYPQETSMDEWMPDVVPMANAGFDDSMAWREIGMCDSTSQVAEGKDRIRIDRWRRRCRRLA